MYIGIASESNDLSGMVAEQFKDCKFLLIVEVEDHYAGDPGEITGVTAIENKQSDSGMELAGELVSHDCEAVITGKFESAVFDFIADSCITRYNGAGYPGDTALDLMERRELKLIRNMEGTDECDDSHHSH